MPFRQSSPVGCRRFEDVAAVAGNRHIERDRYSNRIHKQTKCRQICHDPDILKNNILPFSTSPTINDVLHMYQCNVRNRQFKFDGDLTCHSRDIHEQEEVGSLSRKSCHPRRRPEDDDSFTFDKRRFSVHEPNLAETRCGAAEIRVATHTERQTDRDRQTDKDRQTDRPPSYYTYLV